MSVYSSHNPEQSGFKGAKNWLIALFFVMCLQYFFAGLIDAYFMQIVLFAGINISLAVSLNLVNGFTGQFSMGHAGFMSVGGYVSSYITTSLMGSETLWQGSLWMTHGLFGVALIAGGIVAMLVGYLVGLPSLRLRGDYLAIVTLGFGEIIRVLLLNMDVVGGARGMSGIPQITNFAWIYSIAVITVFCVWRMVGSSQGRGMLAVREDEIAAAAMGVDTTKSKVNAFAFGAFFAGAAGGLFAHQLTTLNPGTFDFNRSFEIIIMVVLGGMGSITGSIAAAILLTGLREVLRPLQEYTGYDLRMVIYSLVLIIVMLTRPKGLFGRYEITEFFSRSSSKKNQVKGSAT